MIELELAEKIMALYRNETGDRGDGDESDLAGLVHLVYVWAESAGLEWVLPDLIANK